MAVAMMRSPNTSAQAPKLWLQVRTNGPLKEADDLSLSNSVGAGQSGDAVRLAVRGQQTHRANATAVGSCHDAWAATLWRHAHGPFLRTPRVLASLVTKCYKARRNNQVLQGAPR
jgi:hypothetical protein